MTYLLDADVLMRAHWDHYRPCFCPAFWDWVIGSHASRRVYSIDKVFRQILTPPDLVSWASSLPSTFFLPSDVSVTTAFPALSAFASSRNYTPAAISGFLNGVDYYLIAHAVVRNATVVTHEVSAPLRTSKVKIPDACLALNVPCINPFEMLQRLGACFTI